MNVPSRLLVLLSVLATVGPFAASAQTGSNDVVLPPPPPPSASAPTTVNAAPPAPAPGVQPQAPAPAAAPSTPPPDTQRVAPPAAQEPLPTTPDLAPPPLPAPMGPAVNPEAVNPSRTSGPVLDGHLRSGPFLSGPGSLTFITHHTLMAAAGGFTTQAVSRNWSFTSQGSREAVLIGSLAGAGLGFGVSSWWQFNHWMGLSTANFGVVNSLIAGLFVAGLAHLFTNDPTTLTWTAFIGTELGAWLTVVIGTGDLPVSDGLLVGSGGLWGLLYGALLVAIVDFSGSRIRSFNSYLAPLLIAPGIGAGLSALATMRFHPSVTQLLRADALGLGVGAAVLLISALAVGTFQSPTPYALGLLGSVGAIAAVSLFWEESAERPKMGLIHLSKKDEPYRCAWW